MYIVCLSFVMESEAPLACVDRVVGVAFEGHSVGVGWSTVLHSLMYVGASVVTKPPFPVDENYVLVGIEI